MATATGMRKSTSSIYDYPEHLNPFREEDNHSRLRFWTLSRKVGRSNSFSLNNIKDFRNTWSLKSFMKKSKKGQESRESKAQAPVNGEASPVEYRRTQPYGWAVEGSTPAAGGAEQRYVYGGSVTPLPRSRFQERMRSTPPTPAAVGFSHMAPGRASFSHRSAEPYALPGLTRGEGGGSRVSVASSNPFDGPEPVPAVRRKKKRAPPPPPGDSLAHSTTTGSLNLASKAEAENKDSKREEIDKDVGIDDPSLNIELKIVEDVEEKPNENRVKPSMPSELVEEEIHSKTQQESKSSVPSSPVHKEKVNVSEIDTNDEITVSSGENSPVEMRNKAPSSTNEEEIVFEKVNIREYRRNSSFNSDQINLYNSNRESSPLTNKRCKSLSNTINTNTGFTAYDITLHIDEDNNEVKDMNDNESIPQKVVCKILESEKHRKASADNSISSTEKEFIEIDRATRQLEQEINKLNSSVKHMDDSHRKSNGNSVSDIKSKFEYSVLHSPNPIPKPRRSRAGSISPVNP